MKPGMVTAEWLVEQVVRLTIWGTVFYMIWMLVR